MSWKDPNEIVVAENGEIYVAPIGTALPGYTNPRASLNAAFVGLGYANEDGVTLTVTPTNADINAWQEQQPVRRLRTAQEVQSAFNLMQWNEDTVPLAFGGGEITSPAAGVYHYAAPAPSDSLDERVMVVDWEDGDKDYRLILPRGNVSEAVASQLRRSAEGLLPISFKALSPGSGVPPFDIVTNDPAFAAGS